MTEIHDATELAAHLSARLPLEGATFQDLDLRPFVDQLLLRNDVGRLVVLGGVVPAELDAHLRTHGAVVFPSDPSVPVQPYRGRLYTAAELYAGLEQGYDATPDARAYHWLQDGRVARDAVVTMVRAIHDDSISDALTETLDDARVVGVMGGHAMQRGDEQYQGAAHLGWELVRRGLVVLTGGGPGAMEAANLGAFIAGHGGDRDQVTQACAALGRVPSFRPSIEDWVSSALEIRSHFAGPGSVASIGLPTWFYGHEPPNVFCDGIAKYFSNAVREDGILARSTAGIVVLPGAAGTVQEIFQAVTPRYYAAAEVPLSPLILVDREQWTHTVPVWPALQALGRDRALGGVIHLVDDLESALALLETAPAITPPTSSQ